MLSLASAGCPLPKALGDASRCACVVCRYVHTLKRAPKQLWYANAPELGTMWRVDGLVAATKGVAHLRHAVQQRRSNASAGAAPNSPTSGVDSAGHEPAANATAGRTNTHASPATSADSVRLESVKVASSTDKWQNVYVSSVLILAMGSAPRARLC